MNHFFNTINNLDYRHHYISATIVKGKYTGHKALFEDQQIIYCSAPLNLWHQLLKTISKVTQPTLITLDNHDIFIELLSTSPRLIICGAGHISMPLIQMGQMIGFHTIVIDDRPFFANNAREAMANHVICDNFITALSNIDNSYNDYYVIVTRGHRYDIDCLKIILNKPSTYIGMIGSKMRIQAVKSQLLEEGFESQRIEQVHMPIGLKIKAETPEEIAISIMAELIQVKNNHSKSYHYNKEMLERLSDPIIAPLKKAMVTIIHRKGSAPRNIGTKMIVLETGQTIGTIGGGCAESAVLQEALKCIRQQKTLIYHVDMTGREVEDDGMICGGIIDVFIDPFIN